MVPMEFLKGKPAAYLPRLSERESDLLFCFEPAERVRLRVLIVLEGIYYKPSHQTQWQ